MRKIAVMVGVFAIAACAGDNRTRLHSNTNYSGTAVARAPSMTDDEFKNYIGERAEQRLGEICGAHQTISRQFACVRDALFRGFDTTGEAKRNCESNAPIKKLMRCAIMGSLGYELATEAKLDQASNYNWTDPEAALKESLGTVAKQTLSSCMDVDLSAIDDCVINRVADSFSLSESQVGACTDEADTDMTLQCMIRVHLIQRFETAFQRMGPGAGQQA
jgi:hypothetical protein